MTDIILFHSCDSCGRDRKDADEMLCNACRSTAGLTRSERMVLATLAHRAPHSLPIKGNPMAMDLGIRLSHRGLVTLDHSTDTLSLTDDQTELAHACLTRYPETVLADATREAR